MDRPSGRRALVAAVVALLSAACGGAASTGPEPIRIGSIMPITSAGFSGDVAGLFAAARDVNAHGGIHGRPLEIDNCDDHQEPNLAEGCARRLVGDRVIATAGSLTTFSMVQAPILNEAGIPEVGSYALNPEDTALPTAFPLDGGGVTQITGLIAGIKRRGLHSLFIFSIDIPSGRIAGQLAARIARAAGMQAGEVYAPSAVVDYSLYVQTAIQSHAEVVYPALFPNHLLPFLAASKQAAARYLIAFPYGALTPNDIERFGGVSSPSEHSIEFAALPPVSAGDRFPAVRMFSADMDAELASGDPAAAPAMRTAGAQRAWLSVQIIAGIASTLTVVDASHVLDALRTQPTVDTLGLTPPWSPGKTGPAAFPRITNGFGYFVTQSNGVEVLVDPTPFDTLALLAARPPG